MRATHKTLALWVLLILVFWAIYQIISQEHAPRETVRFSDMIERAEGGDLSSLRIEVKEGIATFDANSKTDGHIVAYGVLDGDVLERLDKTDLNYSIATHRDAGFWQTVLMTWLPLIFVIAFFFFFMRALQGKNLNLNEMKKAKPTKTLIDGRSPSFQDVVGARAVKDGIVALEVWLRSRTKTSTDRPPPGLLLVGAPGTGKTLLVDAIAQESKLPVLCVKGPEVVEIFAGLGASRIRDLFEKAKAAAPAFVVIDSIDAFAQRRGAELASNRHENEQTLLQLFASMSEAVEKNVPVVVIATTNRPDLLDPALTQSGRFGRALEMPLPDEAERAELLRRFSKSVPLDAACDPSLLAVSMEGLTHGQIRAVIDLAAVSAKNGRITAPALNDALDGVRAASPR